ncbi:spermidine synthase [Novosphingobium sp.]|uniref:spermidine synthase n=1 Tax=Novosphingobium sp. TaxID=1874826 RepID=UPI003BAB61EE
MSALNVGEHLVDTAFVPDGSRLRLIRSGTDFAILLDDNELMSTDLSASEGVLASAVCAELGSRYPVHMLIGGYGMGYTLRSALRALGGDAEVTVAEIVPKIVEWAKGPMARITDGCLDDPRVQLVQHDVAFLIESAAQGYDCILLDVDNGPEGLTRGANDWLYSPEGLAAARSALKEGGILGVWSASHDDRFAGTLARSGFAVTAIETDRGPESSPTGQSERHVIIMAVKRR